VKAARHGAVVDERATLEAVSRHRAAGRTVVFTNGAFDLLHVGHVRMLQEAATLGDVLVVGVNSDASVAASKGPERPVVPQAERAELVASVAGVDLVTVFSDRTVDRLLRLVRPDVHAKGRDYGLSTHPEARTNREAGIRMAFVGDEKSHSTTALMSRLHPAPPVVPPPDRVMELPVGGGRAMALKDRLPVLRAHGLLDLRALLTGRDGVPVNVHETRTVWRIALDGATLFLKTEQAKTKRGSLPSGGAFAEMRNHLALRAAGLRAPEPWLAVEGRLEDGRRAGALLTAQAPGTPLDEFLKENLAAAPPRARTAWARGVGLALRALHTARFLHPDLHAWHLVVDGTPSGGVASITFLDLARLERAKARVGPKDSARGLAALALTLRGAAPRRFRWAVLRAYLGGRLTDARPWAKTIDARIKRISGRRTFRRFAKETV
jgi:rfaE bifunctional protein nucleotidyltransferase chain/domain